MSTIKSYYRFAELATASYAELYQGMPILSIYLHSSVMVMVCRRNKPKFLPIPTPS